MSNNQTCVDMFNFKESASGANVDIITIEDGQQENNLDYRNRSFNRNSSSNRNTSPFRDRVQERYNRSLSPTLSPRLKRSPVPRSVSPGRGRSKPLTPRTPRSVASSPLKSSPAKSYNFGLNNSLTNESTDEEVRRLRFENLILQSKVDTLEAENKSLKEMSAKPVPVFSTDNKILSRQITQLNQDLNAATRKIDKLKKDNDDLTSQLYSLKVDRLEKPKRPEDLQKDGREDWTGCQADAIEHLCSENQRLRETIFDMNEQKLHVHKLLEEGTQGKQPRKRLDSCQLENEQLSEEKKRLLARLETVAEEASKSGEKFSKMKEDYASALSQILSLQAQLMKYEEDGSNKAGMENNTIRNLSEKCAELQDKMEQKEADFEKQMKEKEQEMQDQVDYHVKKLQDIEREVKRVSNVCELLCQEKDNAIQTLQKQIDTNAILSRSNEQLQNTVTEQSDRIRDLVYRQMRDTEVINELKNDFEYVLRERNELDNRVKHDKQVHLQRLASLKEQIHIARLSFAVLVEMLQDDTSLDTEKREELLRQLAEIDSQLGALQREILDIERMEAENIQVEMDEITVQFLKKSEQCEALQTQLSAVELDKSRLSKKHVDLETSLNDTKTSVDNFEAKCDELRQALHKKQIENDTMKAQLDKVKMKLGIMEGDKDTVEAKSRDLKAKNEELCDNAVELDVGLKETKKKLHQKESLSLILNQQMDEWEDRTKHLSNQISQLQKGLSRGTIQIGLLNEDLRVALSALFALNANVDSGEMEENLEILEDVSQQLEELEVALERTMGNVPGLLDLPLRGSSGEKISQLLQELDFYKENSPQVQNVEKGKKVYAAVIQPREPAANEVRSPEQLTTGNLTPTPGNLAPTPGNLTTTYSTLAPTHANLIATHTNVTPTPGNLTPTPGNLTPTPGNLITTHISLTPSITLAISPAPPGLATDFGSVYGSSSDEYRTPESPTVYPNSASSSQDF